MSNQGLDPEIFEAFTRLTQDQDEAQDYYEGYLEAIRQATVKSVDQWQDARESLPRFSYSQGDLTALLELVA